MVSIASLKTGRWLAFGPLLCKRAKAPDDFSNAAKLILLVDVRGADDFRAKIVNARKLLMTSLTPRSSSCW